MFWTHYDKNWGIFWWFWLFRKKLAIKAAPPSPPQPKSLFKIKWEINLWSTVTSGVICLFSVWPIPRVQNRFQKQIWNKNVHICNQKFFLEHLDHHKQIFKIQKLISHWIMKKMIFFWGGGLILGRNFFLKKPNTPEYAWVLVVMCPKLNSAAALLSPSPYDCGKKECWFRHARS